ncbi:MAG: SpoIIE family protein phosphatase [Candidatus Latescibacteria bacterium]|nr:SpoIIE family protein phosphatase [Candidatus Latescibacterota bacterium]
MKSPARQSSHIRTTPSSSSATDQERRAAARRESDRALVEAEQHFRRKTENLARLIEITSFMNSTIVLEDLLSRIMNASKRVVNADASSLFLVDEVVGELIPMIIEGGAGGKLKEAPRLRMGHGIAGWVAQQGRSELIEDAYQDSRFSPEYDRRTGYHTKSMICVPIKSKERIIGVSQVINKLDGERFDHDDLELFEAFCAQAAVAIENARMHQALLEQQRLEQDLQFAQTIQQSFLPQLLPDIPGYSFATVYVSARQVSGDFYDFIEFSGRRLGVVFGDVSGKGVPAALYMAKLMSDFRFFALSEPEPARAVSRVNNLLVDRSRRGMFVTFVYLLIDLESRTMTVTNAGHLPPLICQGRDGLVIKLAGPSCSPLGIIPDIPVQSFTRLLEPGDAVVLYTDGVLEARNPMKQEFGYARLEQVLHSAPSAPEPLLGAVHDALHRFMGRSPQHDDITLLCVGVSP